MNKILVTPRSLTKKGHPALDRLTEAGFVVVFSTPGEQPSEEELCAKLPGCVGYLAGVEKVTARVLESAPALKVISRNGTGIDNVDLAVAERLGIRVCRAEGANARGVAELTIGLLLSLARQIPYADGSLKTQIWQRRQGFELEGRTLGVIGCGKIGKLVTQMALALGMRVLAYDLFVDATFTPSDAFRYAAIEEIFAQSDVITLHCPPAPDGQALIDASAIARMKHGVYLINTARADLLDAQAVEEGIAAGRIAGLALDVFASEPPSDYRLVEHDRVIATPHVGGFTEESVSRAVSVAVDNLLAQLSTIGRRLNGEIRMVTLRTTAYSGSALFPPLPPPGAVRLRWLGQAGFALCTATWRVLIDPYLSDHLARKYQGTEFPHIRMMAPPALPEAIHGVDAVLCSHRHSDHMDPGTLPTLAANNPACRFILPRAEREAVNGLGIPEGQIITVTAGDRLTLDDSVRSR